jgi:hypothetical protein
MSIKSLPQIGDSNWGTTLNDYLGQTLNSSQGGNLNQFYLFSDRPTNLTADDKGKTYLNLKTGNYHEWTGTAWKVLNQEIVNVQDYGGVISNTKVDFNAPALAAVNYAIANNISTVFFPSGWYALELVLPAGDYTIKGQGVTTKLFCKGANKYVITLPATGTINIEDLEINGIYGTANDYSESGYGIFRSSTTGAITNLSKVNSTACLHGFHKEGNARINAFECSFGNDISIFAINSGTVTTGDDHFINCKIFFNISLGVYYNNHNQSGPMSVKFEHCWFEQCKGLACIIKGTGTGAVGVAFNYTWFEANARYRGQPIPVDGTNYICREMDIENCNVILDGCTAVPLEIKLTNKSHLKANNCGNFTIPIIDSTSIVEVNSAIGDGGGAAPEYLVETTSVANIVAQSRVCMRTRNTRPNNTKAYKNLVSAGTFASLPVGMATTGSASFSLINSEGMYNNRSIRVAYTANDEKVSFNFTQPTKPYVFYSYSIRSESNTLTQIELTSLNGRPSAILTNNIWRTYQGIVDGAANAIMTFTNKSDIAASFLISKLQVVEFDTLQEAHNYFKSDLYALPSTEPITSNNDSIPTTGAHVKGEILYNTNPTSGGYAGWICTASGTPGTWNPFGAIV